MATTAAPTAPAKSTSASTSQGSPTQASRQVKAPAAPTLPPAPKSAGPASDPFADLDALDSASTPAPAAKPAAKAAEAPNQGDRPQHKPVMDDPVKPKPEAPKTEAAKAPETPAGDPAPEVDPSAKFQLTHDLRKAFRTQHKELEEARRKLSTLEQSQKNNGHDERLALAEENQRLKSRIEEKEKELRYLDYTKSDEFKNKFEAPFREAVSDAYEEVKELWIETSDGQQRPATSNDFDRVLEAPPQEMRRIAKELFGDAAPEVIQMRKRIIDLRKNADREAKRYQEESKVRQQNEISERAQTQMRAKQLFEQASTEIVRKYPQYFGHVEGDEEINQALDSSYQYIDSQLDPSTPLEDRIATQAAIRHRAAAFKPMLIKTKRLEARVKELEGVIAEYEASAPGEGQPAKRTLGDRSSGYEEADTELDRIARAEGD